jgi:hypothetical protein
MFSTDHPYASMTQARAFLDQLPVSPADREQISHANAERLLRLFETSTGVDDPRVEGRPTLDSTRSVAAGEPSVKWDDLAERNDTEKHNTL